MQNNSPPNAEILFDVATPLGFSVRTTTDYWQFIVTIEHPIMLNRLANVQATLSDRIKSCPSKADSEVYLFYRYDGAKRWVCAVARRLDGEGFFDHSLWNQRN